MERGERGAESCERSDSKGSDPPLASSRRGDTPGRWLHRAASVSTAAGKTQGSSPCVPCPGAAPAPTKPGATQGCRKPSAFWTSPADEAALSIGARVLARQYPQPAHLHPPWGHHDPRPAPATTGGWPWHLFFCHFCSPSHRAGAPQAVLPPLAGWLCGRAPASCPPPGCATARERSNPACGVVQCTSIASSPYGRTCCILIYCLFG